jgi:hypothetical protein
MKHDIICVKMTDLREQEFPKIGLLELEDKETGEQILVDTSNPLFLKNYNESVLKNDLQLMLNLRKLKVDYIKILSDEDYAISLHKLFRKRIRR